MTLPAARRASEEVLDRLLRGHGWLVCVGLLLVGIVFLNVKLLELDGRIARDSERVATLRQENGNLRLRAAQLGSSERVQRAAGARGLVWPAPGDIRYVHTGQRDGALAATRMTAPDAARSSGTAAGAPGSSVAAGPSNAAGSTPGATAQGVAPTTSGATAPTGAGSTPAGNASAPTASTVTPVSTSTPSAGASPGPGE